MNPGDVTPRTQLRLSFLPVNFAVCRIASDEPIPAWATEGKLYSLTKTPDELSIVCEEDRLPSGVRAQRGWRALRVAGTLDFSEIGILTSILIPLAESAISCFAISTFNTDYVLVQGDHLDSVCNALRRAGHVIE